MNGTLESAKALAAAVAVAPRDKVDVAVCPPFVHLPAVLAVVGGLPVGGQDCHAEPKGAFTGSVSAVMLAELGCKYVIVGHSERRHGLGETSDMVKAKAAAALAAGLTPIVCVGETLAERESGQAEAVVLAQLKGSLPAAGYVVAYEPSWSIGTGKPATPEDIAKMHLFVRQYIGNARLLYGASVKPQNSAIILAIPNVDGLLVGGASLVAADFLAILSCS